ncbi:PTS fructose transporter subunit IIA [Enterococcus faecium]|uniref:PTS sugar transporter subunit IIA n=1 Tax=Enterococcus faecium TaxID=1352 RepID=UPI0002A3B3FE|nr:PTS mannose/fructose/sorbose family, IIA component [Enterococcus faecium]ELB61689.1 PTS system, mannose/fructose/sorbose family, IIA component [Enterococcus faecium EnGen0047]EME7089501.1 PTS fructose transporter subunit IIA [Enterococcus faecium]EME7185361.1 PTS fructose transporter subunit IIA [Enterococcus faecium]EMF0609568.1 PTS fructose transporter subunit IIA [Enterococcus faecium]MBZ3649712.1 PTS fructose transporter subunit IIA [Enterococcus faecium]
MSRQLVLISHGKFCEELKKSTEMIMGPQEDIYTLPLLPEDGTETYKQKFLTVTASLNDFVVLCDLLGGTPANIISKLIMEGQQITLYAGMNLPMVIEFINSQMIGSEPEFVRAGCESIVSVNELINGIAEEEE